MSGLYKSWVLRRHNVLNSVPLLLSGMPATERAVLQEQLIDIILEVLKRNPQLHYYQGYHDVAVTLLLVVGERMAIAMLHTLSKYHLRYLVHFFSVEPNNFHFFNGSH